MIPVLGECIEYDVEYKGAILQHGVIQYIESWEDCHLRCLDEPECNYFTYQLTDKFCWLRSDNTGHRSTPGHISGPKRCEGMPHICIGRRAAYSEEYSLFLQITSTTV